MGKGKEKKKDKKDDKKDKKLSGAAKTAAKTAKNAAQKAKKAGGGEGGDMEDLDALLNEFKKIDAKKTEITVAPCAAPGPRTHSSFLTSPVKDAEIVMFGGEFLAVARLSLSVRLRLTLHRYCTLFSSFSLQASSTTARPLSRTTSSTATTRAPTSGSRLSPPVGRPPAVATRASCA